MTLFVQSKASTLILKVDVSGNQIESNSDLRNMSETNLQKSADNSYENYECQSLF